MRYMLIVALLTLAILLALSSRLCACPSCRDAVPSTSDAEEDEQLREARAYNYSIYLMVGMPYLLLGVVGFGIYRGLRGKRARDTASHGNGTLANENGTAMLTMDAGVR
jgi:hypothetical protein